MSRHPDRDLALALDMLLSAKDALEFAGGLSFDDFQNSKLHQNAIIRTLEVIGEAASKTSTVFRDENPQVPWRDMAALRHRLIHAYNDIQLELVWTVIRDSIPELISQLSTIVPPEV